MGANTKIDLRGVSKSFTLHVQDGVQIPVLDRFSLRVDAGDCAALVGPSGAGKSTILRIIFASYLTTAGQVLLRHGSDWIDMASAHPHAVLDVRRRTLGYVSQFLRIVPRVPALDIVAEPLRTLGTPADEARDRAAMLLRRLNVPENLWPLSPMTFSGGEQQRINIARCFVHPYPILLLDEPTASLDAENRDVVAALIREACANGAAILGIFHDREVRQAIGAREVEVAPIRTQAA